jgi:signal peptidase I
MFYQSYNASMSLEAHPIDPILIPDNPIQEENPDATTLLDVTSSEGIDENTALQQEPPGRTKRMIIDTLQTIVLALIFYFAIDTFIGRVQVLNVSMLPTLHEGQFLLVNRFAYKQGNFERGDIIIFHNPTNPEEDYIKRLVGIPGDVIDIENGVVRVNSELLEEPYISEPPQYAGEWTVPDGYLFVLGDNRNSSYDSHSWGYLPQENVIGKAIVIYWPPKEIQIIRHDTFGYAEGSP